MIRIYFISVFSFFLFPVYASDNNSAAFASPSVIEYSQWFTGSILTPAATTLPPNHPGLELELIATNTYGYYDSNWKLKHTPAIWGIQPLFDFQMGFNSVLGIEFIGSLNKNYCEGVSSTHLNDSYFRCGFQISTDKEDSWIPDFRILFQETLPTGNYQKLNPRKKETDLTGEGSFQSGIQFVIQKLFFAKEKHPLRLRGSIGYFVPSPVFVEGFNYYGGDATTKGKVSPGKYITTFLYGECAVSRTWALACEFNYLQGEKGKFSRIRGEKMVIPSFTQFCILPEIQHTYSENLGIIIGGWFTVAGKNSSAFKSVFCSILIIF